MHLALPQRKIMFEQVRPAILAIALVAAGTILIPVQYPVQVSQGKIVPDVVRAADDVGVHWVQNWRELCPVTITREFIGSDGFLKTAAPYEMKPPAKTGTSPFNGNVVIPALPDGSASYRSKIEPHCWVDLLYQRHYYTPEVRIVVVQKTPPGPR